MKKTYIGWINEVCPECGLEHTFPPNILEAICDCGAKYAGMGRWISVEKQIKESKINPNQ